MSRGGHAMPAYPQYPQYPQVSAPPPSLAPVAMSSYGEAGATGPYVAQPPPNRRRSRPTLRTGVAILLAGIVIGGLFGIGMRAQNDAGAAAAHQTAMRTEQTDRTAPPGATAAVADAPKSEASAPASPYAAVPFGSLVVPPASSTPSGPETDSPSKTAPRAASKAWKRARAKGDGHNSASAQPKTKSSETRSDKAADVPKPKASKAGGGRAPDDASKVLKAAKGAIANSL